MSRTLAITAALALIAVGAACDTQTCTLIGCPPPLTLSLEGVDGEPLPDVYTYEIVIEIDGEPFSTACGFPDGGALTCEPVEGSQSFSGTVYVEYGQAFFEFYPANGTAFPQQVNIQIFSGDAPVIEDTRTLDPEQTEPNGPDCGGCTTASETFEIAEPSSM